MPKFFRIHAYHGHLVFADSSANWISWLNMRSSVPRFMPKLRQNLPNRRLAPGSCLKPSKKKKRLGVRRYVTRNSNAWLPKKRKRRK